MKSQIHSCFALFILYLDQIIKLLTNGEKLVRRWSLVELVSLLNRLLLSCHHSANGLLSETTGLLHWVCGWCTEEAAAGGFLLTKASGGST